MKKWKRTAAFLLTSLLALSVLGGCGKTPDAVSDPAGSRPAGSHGLRVFDAGYNIAGIKLLAVVEHDAFPQFEHILGIAGLRIALAQVGNYVQSFRVCFEQEIVSQQIHIDGRQRVVVHCTERRRLHVERNGQGILGGAYESEMPVIKTITWKIIPEGTSRTLALETGEVDVIYSVETADVARLQPD